ncbi:hypothetical protein LAZ67_20000901, partial [Cordylochernes scorpioides]
MEDKLSEKPRFQVKLGEDGCTPAAGDGHVSGEQVPKMAFVWGGGQSLVTSADSGRRGELPPGVWIILQDETLALMNEAYEDQKLSRTQVFFWYKCFKDGRKSIADDSRSGRPLTSTTDRNIGQERDLIVADRKITIDYISEILGISCGSCQKLLL